MKFERLADRCEAMPLIARWFYDQWGRTVSGNTYESTFQQLASEENELQLPVHLLAMDNEQVIGVGALKQREMSRYPDREYWLGNVYVPTERRGMGIASRLVEAIVDLARQRGVEMLSLQTEREDGGLYARLGWIPVERVHHGGIEVTVMERCIGRLVGSCESYRSDPPS